MFCYQGSDLVLKQGSKVLPLKDIKQKSPFYLYDIQGIREWYQFFQTSTKNRIFVFFAMKANSHPEVLKVFLSQGAGVDVVSLGEAKKALNLGFSPKKIIFSGVAKNFEELELAIQKGFFQTNVESLPELKRLAGLCKLHNKKGLVGLRVNPNVDFESHPYIKTGLTGHKFGFEQKELQEALAFIKTQELLQLKGLSMHLGSQICDLDPWFQAVRFLKELFEGLKSSFPKLEVLDLGGGLGINYQNEGMEEEKQSLKALNQGLQTIFSGSSSPIIMEPGRFLVAKFGLLCARVEYIKSSGDKNFVILNSGMNHFLRPALYKARHRILPFKKGEPQKIYDVVGPICETGDTFAKDYPLPPLKEGDGLALADTGAYGFVMSNAYNLQVPVQEISFDGGKRQES